MDELDFRTYKTCDYKDADERKYSIVYRFMKEGKRWKSFTVIEAGSVILSFILERTYGKLFDFIDGLGEEGEIRGIEALKSKIVTALNGKMEEETSIDLEEIRPHVIDKEILSTQTSYITNGIPTLKNQYFSQQNIFTSLILSVLEPPACIGGNIL